MQYQVIVRGVLALAWITVAASSALAQPTDEVFVEVRGVPAGSALQLVVQGANGTKTLDIPIGALAADFMSDGKAADIYIDTCENGRVRVAVVEQGIAPPAKEEDCDRRIIAGWLWGRGRRLVIDVRKGALVTDTAAASSGGGLRVRPFVAGRVGGSLFPNTTGAEPTIRTRYQTAGYDQFATNVDERDTALGFEAGVRTTLTSRLATELSYERGYVGGGAVDTNGTRIRNDLAFQLRGSFETSTNSLTVGVPVQVLDRVEIVPMAGYHWWRLKHRIIDALRAGGTQVLGGTTDDTTEGEDWGYGVKMRMMFGRFAVEMVYERTELAGAFEPDGPAAWPADVRNNRIYAGVALFPFGR
jgi:hypothetical protein